MNSDKDTASETINIYVIVVTFNMLTSLAKTLESVRLVSNKYSMYKFNCIIINGNPNDDGHLIAEEYSDIVYSRK